MTPPRALLFPACPFVHWSASPPHPHLCQRFTHHNLTKSRGNTVTRYNWIHTEGNAGSDWFCGSVNICILKEKVPVGIEKAISLLLCFVSGPQIYSLNFWFAGFKNWSISWAQVDFIMVRVADEGWPSSGCVDIINTALALVVNVVSGATWSWLLQQLLVCRSASLVMLTLCINASPGVQSYCTWACWW